MGKNNDRKTKRSERKSKELNKNVMQILIVCEGEKTEPNYFNAIDKKIQQSEEFKGKINVKIIGAGACTTHVVKEAKRIKNTSANPITDENVWVIFDKDDFTNFDKAISEAKKNNFNCAWSNECFELWYLLHFELYDSALDRKQYIEILNKSFNEDFGCTYSKNNEKVYDMLESSDKYMKNAIRNSYKLKQEYGLDKDDNNYHSKCDNANPCTNVDELVIFLHRLMGDDLTRHRK